MFISNVLYKQNMLLKAVAETWEQQVTESTSRSLIKKNYRGPRSSPTVKGPSNYFLLEASISSCQMQWPRNPQHWGLFSGETQFKRFILVHPLTGEQCRVCWFIQWPNLRRRRKKCLTGKNPHASDFASQKPHSLRGSVWPWYVLSWPIYLGIASTSESGERFGVAQLCVSIPASLQGRVPFWEVWFLITEEISESWVTLIQAMWEDHWSWSEHRAVENTLIRAPTFSGITGGHQRTHMGQK